MNISLKKSVVAYSSTDGAIKAVFNRPHPGTQLTGPIASVQPCHDPRYPCARAAPTAPCGISRHAGRTDKRGLEEVRRFSNARLSLGASLQPRLSCAWLSMIVLRACLRAIGAKNSDAVSDQVELD